MAYIKLELPPGVFNHGTDYQSAGRWNYANLVRWMNGSIRPIGGWTLRNEEATTEAPRGCHGWIDNMYDPHIALGSYKKLYAISSGGFVTDITPSGFTEGDLDAEENLGFGGKGYGTGAYGVERPSDGVVIEATSWILDNWGEHLVGCSTYDGKLYEWNLSGAAAQIANSPEGCKSMIVTAERFLFALAAEDNPRLVMWSDREDNTTWTPASTNEAGDFELSTDGKIMSAVRIRGRTLIVTTRDAHIATYQGPPTVYGFEKVGSSCGSASRKGMASIGEGAMWMGDRNFYLFDGSSVASVKCDVLDHVFDNINRSQISKVTAIHNGRYSEVWWFYPTSDSMENNRYVTYNYKEGVWSIGDLGRATGFDAGVFTYPIWMDASGNVYNHENGYAYDSMTPYVESGPINIGNGDNVMHITEIIPDELVEGEVTATLKTRFYPNAEEREYGPYDMSSPTSLRVTGRQVRVRFTGQQYKNWRVGAMRLNVEQGGKR